MPHWLLCCVGLLALNVRNANLNAHQRCQPLYDSRQQQYYNMIVAGFGKRQKPTGFTRAKCTHIRD